MKALIENKYLDAVIKAAIVGLLTWYTILQIQVRDFIIYQQPATDADQGRSLIYLSNRIEQCNEIQNEKNEIVNRRIDQQQDKTSSIERKLDIIIYKLTGDIPKALPATYHNIMPICRPDTLNGFFSIKTQ